MNTINLVAVSYFGSEDSAQLLRSLQFQDLNEWKLFIVDNSGDEKEIANLEKIASKDERVCIIYAKSNLGYLGAVQFAMHEKEEIRTNPLVIMNTDIFFTDKSSLSALHANLLDDVGIIAPSITSEWDTRDQNPYKRKRPSIQQLKVRKLFLGKPLVAQISIYAHSLVRLLKRGEKKNHLPEIIYAAHGSAFILSQEMVTKLYTTPFPLFLFGEEIFIAEMCSRMGQKCVYVPDIQLTHREHKHTGFKRSKEMLNYNSIAIDFCIDLISKKHEGCYFN